MKVVVLLSGGQDSATCLYWTKHVLPSAHAALVESLAGHRGRQVIGDFDQVEIHALSVYYGQRHDRELDAAGAIAKMAGVATHTVVDFADLLGASSSALIDHTKDIEGDGGMADTQAPGGLPTTFVPGRNLLFLAAAATHAGVVDADFIVCGVCQTDYSGYPDCRKDFIDSMQRTIGAGWPSGSHPPRILTPLMHMTKAETVRLARELPGCWDALALTVTCYRGYPGGCQDCPACELRAHGFEQAGEKDPAIEARYEISVTGTPMSLIQTEGRKVIHQDANPASTPVGRLIIDSIDDIQHDTEEARAAAMASFTREVAAHVCLNCRDEVVPVEGAEVRCTCGNVKLYTSGPIRVDMSPMTEKVAFVASPSDLVKVELPYLPIDADQCTATASTDPSVRCQRNAGHVGLHEGENGDVLWRGEKE